jgi:guanylate kinase
MSSEGPARPPGQLLVLSAPSGAGKTTLARRFLARHADAVFSVSATTRAPRGAERDGVDYHFVTPERFAAWVGEGAFAEWAEVHGRRYGTLRRTVEAALARGQVALFDIDVQGGEQLKAAFPREATTVLILPPDAQELERRLRGRSTDGEEVFAGRLAAAHAEVRRGLRTYQYVVVNDELEAALARLEAIAAYERERLAGSENPALAARVAGLRRAAADLGGWRDHAGP